MKNGWLTIGNAYIDIDSIDEDTLECILGDGRLDDGDMNDIADLCREYDLFYNIFGDGFVKISANDEELFGGNSSEE